jgi:hypothetical protein
MRSTSIRGTYLLAWVLLAPGCTGPSASAGAQEAASDTVAARLAVSVITEEGIRDKVFLLAHDSMRGRWTPSPELEQAARWAQARFRELGLRPGGDGGSHLQWYALPEGAGGQGGMVDPARAPNVVAILPGGDRNLRREYVVFSAHMDHVGVGRPDLRGDSIYNGADDNASGTAGLMAIAAAFASLPEPPRRSIAFVLVSGEERGLWGSRHFVDRGRIPPERMVANLNLDMIGRNWPDTIVAVGEEHSDMGTLVRDLATRHPELGLTVIPDPWPGQRFFFRSDHHSFARRGVPAIFMFSGTHEDYHRPGDRPESVDAEKAARVARLAFLAGLEIAQRSERPRWNPESHDQILETPR